MFNILVQLTGGAISKVVADSSAKVKELPVAKPNDALEQFNAEYGNATSSSETFTTFEPPTSYPVRSSIHTYFYLLLVSDNFLV
jgi:hypothetical protein